MYLCVLEGGRCAYMVLTLPYWSTYVTGRPCKGTADILLLLVLRTGAPDDGTSPLREAWPSPGGDDCAENAWGLNPSPVLCIASLSKVQTAAQSYG